jgi:hypothetical protein
MRSGETAARRAVRRWPWIALPLALAAFAVGFAATWSLGGWRGAMQRITAFASAAESAPASSPSLTTIAPAAALPEVSASVPAASVPVSLDPAGAAREVAPAAAAAPTPERVTDLAAALERRAAGASNAEALAAALEAWSAADSTRSLEVPGVDDALDLLAAHGLGAFPLAEVDLERLRSIGLPALLFVAAGDGSSRVVTVVHLEGDDADLAGVLEGASARVSREDLARAWAGEAWIVWREFEALPEVLRVGDAGEGVSWLQRSLAELGFSPGPASGRFDAATELAVRAFQADQQLEPDGTVGPLTKISLYRALGRYGSPQVSERGDAG